MIPYRTVFGLGIFITLLSFAGLLIPASYSSFTSLLPNGNDAALTLLLGSMLMVLGWAAYFCDERFKKVLAAIGIALMAMAIIGVFYPMHFGLVSEYMRPANLFVLLVAGISYVIVALELDRTMAELTTVPAAVARAARRKRVPRLVLVDVVKQVPRRRLRPLSRQLVGFHADIRSRASTTFSGADSKMREYSRQAGHALSWQKLRQYWAQRLERVRAVPAPRPIR